MILHFIKSIFVAALVMQPLCCSSDKGFLINDQSCWIRWILPNCRSIRLFCLKCSSTLYIVENVDVYRQRFLDQWNVVTLDCFASIPGMTSVAQPGQCLRKFGLKQPANFLRLHFFDQNSGTLIIVAIWIVFSQMQFQWWRCSTWTAFAQAWLESACQFLPTTFSSTKVQTRWWHICLKTANNQAEMLSENSANFFRLHSCA